MQMTMVKLKLRKALIGTMLLAMMLAGLPLAAPAYAEEGAPAGSPLAGASAVLSADAKTVTVTSSVYADQSAAWEDLKTAITVQRTGEAAFAALEAGDTVSFSHTASDATIVVTLGKALQGETNALRIAAGALVDENGAPYGETVLQPIVGLDLPAFTGARSYVGYGELTLYFDEPIAVNIGNDAGKAAVEQFLRSRIGISYDGGAFEPLLPGELYVDYDVLYITFDNDMPALRGMNTRIKIEAGVFKDEDGHLNDEMILNDVTPPVITSASVSGDYRDVTVTFNEAITDMTEGSLDESIYLLRNGLESEESDVYAADSVSVEGDKLVLHYAEPLAGENNVIVIEEEAVADAVGNYSGDDMMTPPFAGGPPVPGADRTPPTILGSFVGLDPRDVILVFDEAVENNRASLDDLKASIKYYQSYYTNYDYVGLPVGTALSISGDTLTVRFPSSLFANSNSYELRIDSGALRDLAGNASRELYRGVESSRTASLSLEDGGFAYDGRWLMLYFDNPIADNTIADGSSHLTEKIALSTDRGTTYTTLHEQDRIYVRDSYMLIQLREPVKAGSVRVKIEANALRHPNAEFVTNAAIDAFVARNTPDLKGYLFSDGPTVLRFEDNAEWRANVRDIFLIHDDSEAVMQLKASDYELTEGRLTINPGVFRDGVEYEVVIQANGYSAKSLQGHALKPGEAFFMTAPAWKTENGITASVGVLNMYSRYYYYYNDYLQDRIGSQTIVFELMDGTTPVSIVTADMRLTTGTYTAHFNVSDAATNPNYSVKAFIVSAFDEDASTVGTNLATVVTPAEYDEIRMDLELSGSGQAP